MSDMKFDRQSLGKFGHPDVFVDPRKITAVHRMPRSPNELAIVGGDRRVMVKFLPSDSRSADECYDWLCECIAKFQSQPGRPG